MYSHWINHEKSQLGVVHIQTHNYLCSISSNLIRLRDANLETMMMSSNGNIFRVTGHLCREFTDHRWIPHTKASDAEFWLFFLNLRLNKSLSKQSWGWGFETPSRPLWRHWIGTMVNGVPPAHYTLCFAKALNLGPLIRVKLIVGHGWVIASIVCCVI